MITTGVGAFAEPAARVRSAAIAGDLDRMLFEGGELLGSGAEQQALKIVEPVAAAHPGDHRIQLLIGLLYASFDELVPALASLDKAAALAPDDPMVMINRAFLTLEAGLPAVDLFKSVRKRLPEDDNVLLGLVAAMVAEGRSDRATELLDRELRRKPQWIKGHMRLSRLLWSSGDSAGFARSFAQATAKDRRNVDLWRAYIDTYLQSHLYDRALDVALRARSAAGPHVSFDAVEAVCRSNLGQEEAADAIFRKLRHLPDLGLIERYLRHLFRLGRVEEAAATAEAFLAKRDEPRLWSSLSVAWRLLGDPRWQWLEGDPSFIGIYDLTERLPALDALAARLRGLHTSKQHPFDLSLRGGTQTDGHLFRRIEPEITQLRRAVTAAVEDYVGKLPPHRPRHPMLGTPRAPIRFSGSWSVRLTNGGRHVDHFHPAGWISSALYVRLPESVEQGTSQQGWLTLGEAGELGVALPPLQTVEPKPGRLVLFPSTMWHGTKPFPDGERLTVAFDVARPKGRVDARA